MGTTPIYGFPYPDPSDLVANYPALGQELAEDIEAVLPTLGNEILSATIATQQGTSSGTYTDLATVGPTVTMTTGTTVLIIISATMESTANAIAAEMSFAVSGATTLAALDVNRIKNQNQYQTSVSRAFILTGLTAGANVFTAKYKTSSGTAYFSERSIVLVSI
jgi:hypothetical protein